MSLDFPARRSLAALQELDRRTTFQANVKLKELKEHRRSQIHLASYLSISKFEETYKNTGTMEYPFYPQQLWREAVERKETILGYWDWAYRQVEQEAAQDPI
jgi:hypothetical protein